MLPKFLLIILIEQKIVLKRGTRQEGFSKCNVKWALENNLSAIVADLIKTKQLLIALKRSL